MATTAEYQGMRWRKCDLHIHTPEDTRHWQDGSFKIASPRNEAQMQDHARAFLRRCHELQLECIGITDHNLTDERDPHQWFLTHLIDQNATVAKEMGREPLTIFPGFELDIRYHVLCLFEPLRRSSGLVSLNDALTNMGLAPGARIRDGVLRQPTYNGQCCSLKEVLTKVQKEMKGIVVAAHAFSKDGICNDPANSGDYRDNEDLLALEVNTWEPSSDKVKSILGGTNSHWRRESRRVPAGICGSDGKSLGDPSQPNAVGYRHTWIKMSHPSIESLRQAFLDHQSRIARQPLRPVSTHTHITEMQVGGMRFLEDQQLVLSPELNCIIGGRGSGKSMLFESLRLGMRGEMSLGQTETESHKAAEQVRRLRNTFTDSTRIDLHVHHDGVEDHFVVDKKEMPARIEGRDVEDPPTVFQQLRPTIFSQEEITQLAERQDSLVQFIDALCADLLEPHRNEARRLTDRLRLARQMESSLTRLKEELVHLRQEVAELTRQLEARSQVQDELKRHRASQEAGRALRAARQKADETLAELRTVADDVENRRLPLGSRTQDFPIPDFFTEFEQATSIAYQELADSIRTAAGRFRSGIDQATVGHPRWTELHAAVEQAESAFLKACQDKGLTPDEAEHLRETGQRLKATQAALQAKEAELDRATRSRPNSDELIAQLTTKWEAETGTRKAVLKEIIESSTMPRTLTSTPSPVIKADVKYAGDRDAFLRSWSTLAPDRRKNVGRDWDRYSHDSGDNNIGDKLFDAFQAAIADNEGSVPYGNPVQWLERHLDAHDVPSLIRRYRSDLQEIRHEHAGQWFELMMTRVPDSANVILLRSDGTPAGSFDRRDLSTGQKNTAILSLLLAHGSGPVLIDQPEDELDSEFLFHELVPMLRQAKLTRQLIIVTHSANIPVNADAELVYALRAEGGRGVCRAQGGLDRPDVTRAVLDIMEGSEKAFQLRKEKYHF